MWIIKNRVTGEYDTKGVGRKRDKVNRHGWNTLGHAKCHVATVGFDEWYLDADFVEISEAGIGRIEPVSEYLIYHYENQPCRTSRVRHIKQRLGLWPKEG